MMLLLPAVYSLWSIFGCLSATGPTADTAAAHGDQQNAAIAALVKAEVTAAVQTELHAMVQASIDAAVFSIRNELHAAIGDIGDKIAAAPTTASTGGRDSTVWNISLQNMAGKAGWLLAPGIAAGWWMSKKRTIGALDTVIRAIEIQQCEHCKRAVQAQKNATADQRVQVVCERMNGLATKG